MEKNIDISERILEMLDFLDVNRHKFAINLGYKRAQMLYDVINHKAKPSYDFFERFINSEYSDIINIEWLISGKGEMVKSERNKTAQHELIAVKDQLIASKDENIAILKKQIAFLEKELALKNK